MHAFARWGYTLHVAILHVQIVLLVHRCEIL